MSPEQQADDFNFGGISCFIMGSRGLFLCEYGSND